MRQAAGAQTESMAQTGGQVKDALMGAAATASSVAGRTSSCLLNQARFQR